MKGLWIPVPHPTLLPFGHPLLLETLRYFSFVPVNAHFSFCKIPSPLGFSHPFPAVVRLGKNKTKKPKPMCDFVSVSGSRFLFYIVCVLEGEIKKKEW